ncbi:MAG: hypothetical protein ABI401_06765 [Candidatus Dormibacter sp.]
MEFMQDGSVEIERFLTAVNIEGRERIDDLFARFSGLITGHFLSQRKVLQA